MNNTNIPSWAVVLPSLGVDFNHATHVVVDTDDNISLFRGSEKSCNDYCERHNNKVMMNGGTPCFSVLSFKDAEELEMTNSKVMV